jgi:hypothetical protein
MDPTTSQGRAPAPSPLDFDAICIGEGDDDAPLVTDWVWRGFLAPGEVTLLTSPWKAGKTTLLSIFLARLKCGGRLLGYPVTKGTAIVVSEEPRLPWRQRNRRLDFGRRVHLISQPFRGKPTFAQWEALIDRLEELTGDHGFGLVVLDTLGGLFPSGVEYNGDCMQRALASLRKLTDRGIAVWVLHHPPKGKLREGQIARGAGTLLAVVDISLEMHPVRNAGADDRRRWLRTISRHKETPRKLLMEWTKDDADYIVHNAAVDEEFQHGWRPLRIVLEDATTKLRREDILEQWPPDFIVPSKATLWRWLDRAVDDQLVLREGAGRCNSPYRYFLPEKLSQWLDDPLEFIDEPDMYALAIKRAKERAAARVAQEAPNPKHEIRNKSQ